MAKRITLHSGLVFKSISKAKAHFDQIREDTQIGALLSDPDRTDILDIYQRYCTVDTYPAIAAVEVTVDWDNRERPGATHASTKAFHVIDASGHKQVFSMDKALSAIAS